jgi:catechol 2,3-dioxygenase-like lactoylglutathione lyase family enzyme
MNAKGLTPILNVSDFKASVEWFEKLGWQFSWGWAPTTPASETLGHPSSDRREANYSFGGVCSGECQIFLCEGAQGGRGKGANTKTFGESETADKGVWMSIWVEDVDTVHARCLEQGLDVTFPPTDMEWNVREMHIRHPDGHVFRISRGIGEEDGR